MSKTSWRRLTLVLSLLFGIMGLVLFTGIAGKFWFVPKSQYTISDSIIASYGIAAETIDTDGPPIFLEAMRWCHNHPNVQEFYPGACVAQYVVILDLFKPPPFVPNMSVKYDLDGSEMNGRGFLSATYRIIHGSGNLKRANLAGVKRMVVLGKNLAVNSIGPLAVWSVKHRQGYVLILLIITLFIWGVVAPISGVAAIYLLYRCIRWITIDIE